MTIPPAYALSLLLRVMWLVKELFLRPYIPVMIKPSSLKELLTGLTLPFLSM